MSLDSFERVSSRSPFVVERRVRWSDCDPAGVVYTGKFSDYVLHCASLFQAELAAPLNYRQWCAELAVDTPCKGMELEFHRALWPDEQFWLHCSVSAVREHSYDLQIQARLADGSPVFAARFSPICIARGQRVRVPIPQAYRQALQRHMSAAPGAWSL